MMLFHVRNLLMYQTHVCTVVAAVGELSQKHQAFIRITKIDSEAGGYKVDPDNRKSPLLLLGNILDDGDMERNGNPIDRHKDIFPILVDMQVCP